MATNIFGIALVIYMLGLTLVLAKIANGYEGGDLMTEHYRTVLQFIFN